MYNFAGRGWGAVVGSGRFGLFDTRENGRNARRQITPAADKRSTRNAQGGGAVGHRALPGRQGRARLQKIIFAEQTQVYSSRRGKLMKTKPKTNPSLGGSGWGKRRANEVLGRIIGSCGLGSVGLEAARPNRPCRLWSLSRPCPWRLFRGLLSRTVSRPVSARRRAGRASGREVRS